MRLHQLQRRLTEKPLPDDKHTPAEALFKLDRDDPVERVRGLLRPWRGKVIALLTSIAGMDAKAEPGTARYQLATKPLDRSKDQSRTTEFACDVRAKEVLAEDPDVCSALAELDDALRDIFADHFAAAHRGAAKAFPRPDKEADAGRIAAQFYEWFDPFDAVQFPMTFGTDIGEPDQVDIIRVCPEDAGLLVPDVGERRTKLKGLVAAHFGAFLDRDWRVSDLLWGRLDGAERIITALLPLNESRDLRERLINEAQAAILEEFGASAALRDMTVRESAAPRPGAAPAQTPAQLVAIMNPLPIPPTLSDLQSFMNVWRVMVPRDPERAGLLETLARGTEITGRILDGIATKKSLPPWGSWAVTAGRALWGLVEISIPRSFGVLLGHYWQSLLLVISIVLIVAGLFGAPGVSALGWTLLLADVAIFALRRSLTGFMSGSAPGSLRTIAALTLLILLGAGGWKVYDLAMAGWTKLQALIG
jgi:hypothetical protein